MSVKSELRVVDLNVAILQYQAVERNNSLSYEIALDPVCFEIGSIYYDGICSDWQRAQAMPRQILPEVGLCRENQALDKVRVS